MSRLPTILISIAVVAICIGLNVHRYPMAWEYMRLAAPSLNRTVEEMTADHVGVMGDHTRAGKSESPKLGAGESVSQSQTAGKPTSETTTGTDTAVVIPETAAETTKKSGITGSELQQVRRISFPESIPEPVLPNVSKTEFPSLPDVEKKEVNLPAEADVSRERLPVQAEIEAKAKTGTADADGEAAVGGKEDIGGVGENVETEPIEKAAADTKSPALNVSVEAAEAANVLPGETENSKSAVSSSIVVDRASANPQEPRWLESTSVASEAKGNGAGMSERDSSQNPSAASVTQVIEASPLSDGISSSSERAAQTKAIVSHPIRQHRVLRTSKTQAVSSQPLTSTKHSASEEPPIPEEDSGLESQTVSKNDGVTEPSRQVGDQSSSANSENRSSVIWHSSNTPLTRQRIREMLASPPVEIPPTSDL